MALDLSERWYTDVLALATRLHDGQTDKAGAPYIQHPIRVAARVAALPNAQRCEVQAALLHDVLEDCGEDGAAACFTVADQHAWIIVRALTKKEEQPYRAWIMNLAKRAKLGDRSPARVKLADIADNMDPARTWEHFQRNVEQKYGPAKMILEMALGYGL